MKTLVKKKSVFVRLSRQDAAELDKAVRVESERRGENIGAATLLREYGMERVRELLQQVA